MSDQKRTRWAKFTQKAAAIKKLDSLSAQLQKSYGLDNLKADAEVRAFMGTSAPSGGRLRNIA